MPKRSLLAIHHGELNKGSYGWKEIKETITAPKDAIRMALFFGLLPCKGQLSFDDINIKTASEAEPVATSPSGVWH